MTKKVFIMSKTPFLGATKSKLAQHIGQVNVKRFTTNNIEYLKKEINIKLLGYSIYFYFSSTYKFRSTSFNYNKNVVYQPKGNIGKRIWLLKKKKRSINYLF